MLTKSEVKYIQSLSQKKFRDKEGCYIIEGPKIVGEALALQQLKIKKIYALANWAAQYENESESSIIETIADFELAKISQLKTPNQVLAIVPVPSNEIAYSKSLLCLALDGIQDPGNMGTIIRIADWFGIHQIICSTDCVDAYNAKVVQASMGSIFRVKIYYTDLDSWMDEQKDTAFYGAALDGVPLSQLPKPESGVIVIGNESKGIRNDVMKKITQKITIEKFGAAESLNAAVATGIILSHLK